MTPITFLQRLEKGASNHLTYGQDSSVTGLISVWRHGRTFVLTWEECPPGKQYDESTYTRDERYEFTSTDDLLAFLNANGFQPTSFEP